MRLSIHHEITASYDPAPTLAVREIRMCPRTFDGQYVGDWRIDVDGDCRLDRVLDACGNIVHDFTVSGPFDTLTILAAGEVEVDDTNGVLQAKAERLPPALFLRETRLTIADERVRDLAAAARAVGPGPLDRCHELMHLMAARFEAEPATAAELVATVDRTAAETASRGAGTPAELAHLFIAAARALDVPARFVTGYLWRGDERDKGAAAHAWAEAFVPGLGWVGFDAGEDCCPTDAYVRVAAGLDQPAAAWLRGADHGARDMKVTSRAIVTRTDR